MLSDIAKLQAKHHLFLESLNTDMDLYDEQAAVGISKDIFCLKNVFFIVSWFLSITKVIQRMERNG